VCILERQKEGFSQYQTVSVELLTKPDDNVELEDGQLILAHYSHHFLKQILIQNLNLLFNPLSICDTVFNSCTMG
jgi:hypothetical protein